MVSLWLNSEYDFVNFFRTCFDFSDPRRLYVSTHAV